MNPKSTLEAPSQSTKRRRETQKASTSGSKSFIEFAPDPTLIINKAGRIVTSNELAAEMFGFTRRGLMGRDVELLIPKITSQLRQKSKGHIPQTTAVLHGVESGGKKFPVDVSITSIQIGAGIYMWASLRKVRIPKTTDDDPRIAQAYSRSLIEAALDPLVTISPEGKITDVNEASVRATGVPREKLIGTDFSDYFTEPQKAREGYQQVFAKGSVSDYPLTLIDKEGKLTVVLYNASVYRDDAGTVLGVLAAARDITVLKATEEKFRKIQAYTRSLIETSLDPQITKGPDGKITDVNEATVEITGVPREKLLGTHF